MNKFANLKYKTAEFDAIFRARINRGDTSAVHFLNLLIDIEQASSKDNFQSSTFDKHFRHTFSHLQITTKSLMNYLLLNDFITSFILENKYKPKLQNSIKIWVDTLSQYQITTLLPSLDTFKQEELLSLPRANERKIKDKLVRW